MEKLKFYVTSSNLTKQNFSGLNPESPVIGNNISSELNPLIKDDFKFLENQVQKIK